VFYAEPCAGAAPLVTTCPTNIKVDEAWSNIPVGAAWRCEVCEMYFNDDGPLEDNQIAACPHCDNELEPLAELAEKQWDAWISGLFIDCKGAIPLGLVPYLPDEYRQQIREELQQYMSIIAVAVCALEVSS
jgi:hypothetical protein